MKKEKIWIILLIGVLLSSLLSCNNTNKEESDIRNICEAYVKDCEVEELKDGTYKVNVTAPDFGLIINTLDKAKIDEEFDIDDLEKAIKKFPDYKKEYAFLSVSKDEDVIKKQFFTEISNELMITAITNIEITDEWELEE